MENPVQIPGFQNETLKPPIPIPSPFLACRRRPHLDSASYRTLVHILSHCVSHSLLPDPNPTPHDGMQKGPVLTETDPDQGQGGNHSMVEHAEGADGEFLFDMPDFSFSSANTDLLRSVQDLLNDDDDPDEESEWLDGFTGIDSLMELQSGSSKEMSSEKICTKEGQVELDVGEVEEGEISDDVQIVEDQEVEEHGSIYDGLTKEGHHDLISAVISEIDNGVCTGSRESNCNRDVVNLPVRDIRDEIRQTSRSDRCLEPQMKEAYSNATRDDFKCQDMLADDLGLLGENKDNLVRQNKGEPSGAKGVEVKARKNRGALTEEKKAKRKSAKKRKRAQKDREQGVKRLKLQPIVKPKVVKQCNFYMMGRCQQGDLCRFSHDVVPFTKSQPCKYFACDSCLKGEDCQFDHDLSKYPCHNYMSKGMCTRGDSCKFSHKISVTEDSSTSGVGKSHSPLPTEKRLKTNITSAVVNDPPKSTTSSPPFSENRHLDTNPVKCLKEPLRVPNGIRFLSFGKEENQEKFLDRQKNALASSQSTSLAAKHGSNIIPNRGVCNSSRSAFGNKNSKSSSSGPVVAPFSGSVRTEVSEATKILDEFLFGAG